MIKKQEENCNEIKRILGNVKKDSAARKTQLYIEDRVPAAQENDALLRYQDILSSHKYVTCKYIENKIKVLYHEAISYVRLCEQKLQIVDTIYEPIQQR